MDRARLDEALDVIAQARKSDDLIAIIKRLRDLYSLEHLVYAGLRMPDLVETDPYLIFTYPGEWIERYRREDFFRIDPVFVAAKSGFLPIDWSTLDQQSSEARHLFAEAARYGIGNTGMSFPMRGPDEDAGIFTFTADLPADEWSKFKRKNQPEIAFLGQYFHDRVIRVWADEHGLTVRPILSDRERECLQMLAQGDPPKKIATTLGLSEAAVRLYLKRARARLGAANIMQAVVIALRANLIDVP